MIDKFLVAILGLLLLAGCMVTYRGMVSAATWYCDRSPETRQAVRANVNRELSSRNITVRVTCADGR